MGFLGCNKEKCCNSACFKMIRQVAEIVHNWAVEKYGEGYSLKGGCVEASELMVKILHLLGCENAKTVDGYVRLDNPDDGEEAFEPHVWVEIPCGDEFLYADATAGQFNYDMDAEHAFAPVIVCKEYPYGVTREKPDDV